MSPVLMYPHRWHNIFFGRGEVKFLVKALVTAERLRKSIYREAIIYYYTVFEENTKTINAFALRVRIFHLIFFLFRSAIHQTFI